MFSANFISLDSPRLCKLVHVKLELAIASHGVVALVTVVVAAKATEAPAQMRSSYNLHKTVTVPCDLQTCNGGEFEQVPVEVYMHPRSVVGQGDAGTVLPYCQVLVQAEDQTAQPHFDRLSPGEGASPSSVILHQHREARVWAVDIIPRTSRRDATTITSQNILTGTLKVKGPAVKGVVMRVTKDCTYTWLFSANWAAAGSVQDFIRGAADDWYT